MEIIKKKLEDLNKQEIDKIISYLKNDQVIVIQTDTIYGFSVLASSNLAVSRLMKIKKRKKDKSFILLISSLNMLSKFAYINSWQKEKIKYYFKSKRPITVVLESKKKLTKNLETKNSLAFRLPKSQIFIKIIKRLGEPIVSTSFNFSGQELIDINNVEKIFKAKKYCPDLIVNSNKNKKTKASCLVDIRNDKIKILRK